MPIENISHPGSGSKYKDYILPLMESVLVTVTRPRENGRSLLAWEETPRSPRRSYGLANA
jgi:hypothetical protein